MPYEFHWHDPEHSIIRIDMVGQVSWEAFNIVTDRIVDELAAAPHRVDVIFNDHVGMPKGNPMPHIKSSSSRMTAHANMGLIITVSARNVSSFTKVIVDIAMKAYQVDRAHVGGFVETLDEAMRIINKSRALDAVKLSA